MINGIDEVMNTAKNAYGSAQQGAERAVETTRDAAEAAKSTARSTLSSAFSMAADGAKMFAGLRSVLHAFGVDDVLGWAGLRRRRGSLSSVVTFGAGVAVGAGIGVLFAPSSGAALRRSIVNGFQGLKRDIESEAKADIERVGDKVEDLAGKAKGAAQKVERKIEHGVESASSAAKDAAGQVKGAVETPSVSLSNGR